MVDYNRKHKLFAVSYDNSADVFTSCLYLYDKKMLFGTQAEIKMAEAKLADGTTIYCEDDEFRYIGGIL